MKKIILIISCILSIVSFTYFKEIRGEQQLNKILSLSRQKENEVYSVVIAANDIGEQQAQILVKQLYEVIDDFDVAIRVELGNLFLNCNDFFIAGNHDLTNLVIPYRYIPKNPIDFLDESNSNYYSNNDGRNSDLFMLGNKEINIYPLSQLKQYNSLAVAYTMFSNDKHELDSAVDTIFESDISGLFLVDYEIGTVDFSSIIFNHSVSILVIVIILLFSLLLIENLKQDKQIIIRKLQGQSSLRITAKINLRLMLLSLIGLIGTYILLFIKDNMPINTYTTPLIFDCILFILMVFCGFIIISIVITLLIKRYTISNRLTKRWILSEKFILVAMSIMVAISIVGYQKNIASIFYNVRTMKANNALQEKYGDYNYILSINGLTANSSEEDDEKYINIIEQLEEKGMIFLPIYQEIVSKDKILPDDPMAFFTLTPDGVLLETNYNYINELNLVNDDGELINIRSDEFGMIIDSSLKEINLEEMCNTKKFDITKPCKIDYVDDLQLTYFSPFTTERLAQFENDPAYVLEYKVSKTRGGTRYITPLSENEINDILDQSTLSLDAYISNVEEYCEAENNSSLYNISQNMQTIMLMFLSIISLMYLYVILYTRINNREIAIRNSLGQSVIKIHSNLIVYLCCSGIVLVYLSYVYYKTSDALWYFIGFIVASFILCFIACVTKNKQRRIK